MKKEHNTMRLKVIKEIKGLVPGDILTYNSTSDSYDLYKVEEDISESGVTKKTIKITIGEWLVSDYLDYFIYIDKDGNEIIVNELTYDESPSKKEAKKEAEKESVKELPNINTTETIEDWKSEVIKLTNKIKELEKELEDYKNPIDNYIKHINNKRYDIPVVYTTYNPFRTIWSW